MESQVVYHEEVEQRMVNAAQKALEDTAAYFIKLVKERISKEDGIDTGEMIDSFSSRIVGGGNRVEVFSKTAQAVIMELWRWAGKKRPPMESLVGWASRKWIVSGSTMADMDSKEKWILYVMAKSIGDKGIAPRRYFTKTFQENERNLEKYYVARFTFYMW